nr:2-dehydro-3-deoxy-6-phosphogalactonate aldolase [Niveibacterium umoris]
MPVIAILRGLREHEVAAQLDALLAAGIEQIEIPLNASGAEATLGAALGYASTRMRIGAGTVLDVAAIERVAAGGARFVLTPNVNAAVIRRGRECGLDVIAGVATPSEAFAALDAGATGLKLFPAISLGVNFVSALRAVLPPVQMVAVGGISAGNLRAFIEAGCTGVGLGSALYRAGRSAHQTYAVAMSLRHALEGCPA